MVLCFSALIQAAAIGKPKVTAVYNSSKGADIRWKAASGAKKYAVYRSNAGKRVKIATVPAGQTKYIDKSVKNSWGKVYGYSVASVVGTKTYSRSNEVMLKRIAPMKIAKLQSNDPGTVTIKFSVSTGSNKASGYEIQYAKSQADLKNQASSCKSKTVSGKSKTTVKINNLTEGETYYFRVRAYGNYKQKKTKKSWGQYSSIKSIQVKTTPAPTPEPVKRYEEGQYYVGLDIPAGEYIFYATTDISGYYCESRDSGAKDIIDNDIFENNAVYTISPGTFLKLSRCYAVPSGANPAVDTTKPGQFIVGKHIQAGTYQVLSIDDTFGGYYCIYPDSRKETIVENDIFNNNAYVTVSNGQILCLSRAVLGTRSSSVQTQEEEEELLEDLDTLE